MPLPEKLEFPAVIADQSADHKVVTIAARASEVLQFASIDRVARDAQGELSGFQRPQVAAHIREIQDYLEKPDSVLPNAIVVAFTGDVALDEIGDGIGRLTIDVSKGKPGLVVDGQQRRRTEAPIRADQQHKASAQITDL